MICPTCGNTQARPTKETNTFFCDRCRTTFYQASEPIRQSQPIMSQSEVIRGDTFDFEQLLESMVQLKTEATEGVGFIVSEKGHVMTNAHVLDGAEFCIGQLAKKTKRYEFDVVADGDPLSLDLCLLKPSEEGEFQPMKLSETAPKVGETVFTIGNPKGLGISLTKGVISQINGSKIQLDMSVNPGNSGGPVLNEKGHVVGVISYLLKDVQGLGFAVHIEAIKQFMKDAL